uniref:At2g35280-like TPR domain-containing protein n=1 Tax=Oryza glumipatula TaxID=40148 RepID=A0A0E0A0T2_9ORYZ
MVSTWSMAVKANAKKLKRPSAASATMKELALCYDSIVHIACLVGVYYRPTQPTCHEGDVGRHVPLERPNNMKWMENERYLTVVNHLVSAGFIIGVTLVFTHQDMKQGLLFLNKAATSGHKMAAYVLILLLYKSNEAHATRKKCISQVEGDSDKAATGVGVKRTNRECQRCQKITEDVIQEATWKVGGCRSRMLVLPEDSHQCMTACCGVE